MSDIQRWAVSDIQRWDIEVAYKEADDSGEFVTYADHVAAVAEAEQRSYDLGRGDGIVLGQEQAHRDSVIIHEGAAENRGFRKGYEQGQRDAMTRAANAAAEAHAAGQRDAISKAVAAVRHEADCPHDGACACEIGAWDAVIAIKAVGEQ
jgi:flagellar biosynthesis/type III secretory pathway protein FliH